MFRAAIPARNTGEWPTEGAASCSQTASALRVRKTLLGVQVINKGSQTLHSWSEADRKRYAKVVPIPGIQNQLREQLFNQTLYFELT